MARRWFLDHAATTPLLPQAREAMMRWLDGVPANASSLHAWGRESRQAIDSAREQVSQVLGCLFGECLFVGSGSEAANTALVGTALAHQEGSRRRFLVNPTEHHCVLEVDSHLRALGFLVDYVRVDSLGVVDLNDLEFQLERGDVVAVALMHANNETGVIQPARAAADLTHRFGALLLCDAVQTLPWAASTERWTVDDLQADVLWGSAHKFGGPPGVGILYVRSGTPLKPLIRGGGQEREMRAGTENVAGIVGTAAALAHVAADQSTAQQRKSARDAFLAAFAEHASSAGLNWTRTIPDHVPQLDGHAHIGVPGVDAEMALIRLDRAGIAAAAGAACSSGSLNPSHVLIASGWSEANARQAIRFSLPAMAIAEAQQAAEVAATELAAMQSRLEAAN